MHRAGHASPAAALRYQHATADRDRALADALAQLANVVPLSSPSKSARSPATELPAPADVVGVERSKYQPSRVVNEMDLDR
jgi:hypothetical protein